MYTVGWSAGPFCLPPNTPATPRSVPPARRKPSDHYAHRRRRPSFLRRPLPSIPSLPTRRVELADLASRLIEVAGTPALVTGLTIDGVAQTLSQYFPSTAIQPKGTAHRQLRLPRPRCACDENFRLHRHRSDGTRLDAAGGGELLCRCRTYNYFNLNATPLTAVQNPGNAACPWSVQLNLDDLGGYGVNIDQLSVLRRNRYVEHRLRPFSAPSASTRMAACKARSAIPTSRPRLPITFICN